MRFTETITRLRGDVGAEEYGNTQIDWSDPDEATYPGEIQPESNAQSSVEVLTAGQRTTTRWRGFTVAGADIKATDRLVHLGVTYEVDGEVERHRTGGREHHVEFKLLKVTES